MRSTVIDDARAQRKRRRKIAATVDRVTWGDKLWFERFPQRLHRVRIAAAAELEELGIPQAPPGYRQFAVVRSVTPDIRQRLFVLNAADAETDVDEETARAIFEQAYNTPGIRGLMRQAVRS